ncbi:MAG: S1C family serine protease [Crocinitomicaceae bacterium]
MRSKVEVVLEWIDLLIDYLPTWAWILIGVIILLAIIAYFDSKRPIIKNKKSIKLTKPILPNFKNNQEVLRYAKKATVLINVDGEECGAGVFISGYGFIVTNYRIIEFKGKIQIRVINGEMYDAKVVHMDDGHNLALLKIKGKNFVALPSARRSSYETGDKVFAIGSPWCNKIQDNPVTTGIVNTKRDSDGCSILETDALINLDNNGGPLVNAKGEIVGINVFDTIVEKEISFNASYSIDINHAFERLKIRC